MKRILFAAALLALSSAGSLLAQDPGLGPVPQPEPAQTGLIPTGYTREIFDYPRFARPNPVQPPEVLTVANAFLQLSRSGILYDEKTPANSRAVLWLDEPDAAGSKRRFVVKAGDRLTQYYRIVKISRDEVHVDELRFGTNKRLVLTKEEQSDSASARRPPLEWDATSPKNYKPASDSTQASTPKAAPTPTPRNQ
jgi:hypothetical protein